MTPKPSKGKGCNLLTFAQSKKELTKKIEKFFLLVVVEENKGNCESLQFIVYLLKEFKDVVSN